MESTPEETTKLVQNLNPKIWDEDKHWMDGGSPRGPWLSRTDVNAGSLSPQTDEILSERGREGSQTSYMTQLSDTTDTGAESVVSIPTWKNGAIAYVDPSTGQVSRELTFTSNITRLSTFDIHLPQWMCDRHDTSHGGEPIQERRGDFIYRNADFYSSLRRLSSCSTDGHPPLNIKIPDFNNWSEAAESVIENVGSSLCSIKATVAGVGLCAGIPIGTYPALGHGTIAVYWWLVQAYLREMELGRRKYEDIVDIVLEFIECAREKGLWGNSLSKFCVLSLSQDWAHSVVDRRGNRISVSPPPIQPLQLEYFQFLTPLSSLIVSDLSTKAKFLRRFVEMPSHVSQAPNTALYGQMLMARAVFRSALCVMECLSVNPEDELKFIEQKIKMFCGLIECERHWEVHETDIFVGWGNVLRSAQYLAVLLVNLTDLLKSLNWTSEPENTTVLVTPDPSGLVYDHSGGIRGGTRAALLATITHHDQLSDATAAFLLTYPAFLTDLDFIDLLQDRFAIQPLIGLTRESFVVWEETIQRPIRLRVTKVLKQLLESYWPLDADEEVVQRAGRFIDRLRDSDFPGSSKLKEIFIQRTAGEPIEKPRKSSAMSLEVPMELRPHRQLSLGDVPPLEMARQITLRNYHYFSKISPRELLWRHKSPKKDNVAEFIKAWNQEVCWIVQQVLEPHYPLERARRIEYFIRVSKACQDLKNFSAMMSVITALYSAGVYRLGATWPLVKGEVVADLQVMCRLMNSARNFSEYRVMLSLVANQAVPFLGICLMDLRFSLDGNSDFLGQDPGLVNWAKWSQCAAIISETLRFQDMSYPLMPLPEVQNYLAVNTAKAPSLNALYDLSRVQEPKA